MTQYSSARVESVDRGRSTQGETVRKVRYQGGTVDRSRLRHWPSSHRISTRAFVWAQIFGAAAACVALACGLAGTWALVIAFAVGGVLLIHVGGWSLMSWIGKGLRYLRHRTLDGGTIIDFHTHSDQSIGLRMDGSSLVSVVEIAPPRDYLTRIGRQSFDASHLLPTAALVECLHQHDISLSGIDIVSHGYRAASGTPATEVYERLIGPLPATATRSVWLALRFDALEGSAAVARRGGGERGAGRAITVASNRVIRVLDAAGCKARILTAAEIASSTAQVTRGTASDDITETWRSTPLPGVANIGYGVEPNFITTATLARVWAVATVGTSVTIRLRPSTGRGEAMVSATCRFTTRNSPTSAPVPGLVSLRGRQRDGLLTNLPTALTALDRIAPERRMNSRTLDALALPLAGCGQLIGSDSSGHGVTARISGPGVNTVCVAGELYLAQQLIFRAIATGARVLVHTDRPENWTPLIDSMGVPDRLRVSGRGSGPESAFNTVVFDGVEGLPPRAGVTAIYVFGHPRQWPRIEPEISIVQPFAVGDQITVKTGRTHVDLTLVTIAPETSFIGRPRAGDHFPSPQVRLQPG